MDFMTLAQNRYSVRKFDSKPVESEKLQLILRAGHLAPTAGNFQPQRILVINSEEALEKLRECTPYHFDTPAAMLICYDNSACWKRKNDMKSSGDIDASIVTTHMMLEAADIGIGTTWVMMFDAQKMREVYHIPEKIEPVALLVMGYPASDAAPGRQHDQFVNINDIVFYNDFISDNNM